jgi:hypothetical protein
MMEDVRGIRCNGGGKDCCNFTTKGAGGLYIGCNYRYLCQFQRPLPYVSPDKADGAYIVDEGFNKR